MQNAPTAQAPGLYRKKIGDIVVTALIDGRLHASYDLVKGVDVATAREVMTSQFRPGEPVLTINCFIVNTGGKVVLIDTGAGKNDMFVAGQLPNALNAAGVSPDVVDTVLITHLHPDHAGGLATPEGQAFFKNAEVKVHADDAKFWLETDNPPADAKPFFDAAKSAVAPYKSQLSTFTKGEVAPGIEVEHLPGHTPGHSGFVIHSGKDSLLMWTDIVHLPALQSRHPEAHLAFDVDPEQARGHRERLFDKAVADKLLIAGSHMDFPALAHLEKAAGGGYHFVPEVWRHTV